MRNSLALRRTGVACAIVCWAIWPAIPATVTAQDVWELTPCRIKVVIASADSVRLTPRRRENLEHGLVTRTDTLIGAAWQLSCIDAPPDIRTALLDAPDQLPFPLVQEVAADCDQLALVTIEPAASGYSVRVCQWDVATQQLAADEESWTSSATLTDGVFRMLLGSFSPSAKIEPVDLKTVRLRFRGAELPPRSEPIVRIEPGDIFLRRVTNQRARRPGQEHSAGGVDLSHSHRSR